ncbi:multidrug effflux MFS transporter [Epibacterium ulvae]|uniref:multidrug effflux MFS transporter n=1 Tax=Epibacterium ulvae TaxID=1156985 RepID=UPI001BFC25E9|nr:multidrug effflux MFS transporter [Epibacterium ulvae]MBT8155555.1 multidrug effflux MFS transporter [Epibacterium ulvae]
MSAKTPPHIATLILLTGLAALSLNVFLPSLPSMAAHFEVDYRVMQLSISLYLAFSAVVQIVAGPISDKIGRRPVVLWCGVGFMVMTLGCILAPNATAFLVFRMGQAISAAILALCRASIRDVHDTEKAASKIAYVTMGMAVVPMFSPAIGGVVDRYFDWTANFWILFTMAGAILVVAYFDFGETKSKSGKTLADQFREYPELLRSPRFWGYSLAAGLSSGAFFAYLGGAPFVGTEIYGLRPDILGILMSAPAIGYFFGNFASGKFSQRVGVNRMIFIGCLVNLFGVSVSAALTVTGVDSVYTFFGLMNFVGLGNGMVIPNATTGAISVRRHLAGSASGLAGAVMIGVGAVLSALAGRVLVPGSTALPLLLIMGATAVAGVISILMVMRRERRLALAL